MASCEDGSQWCRLNSSCNPLWIKIIGENQEVETEMKNYTLNEIQIFLKYFMQQDGKKGANWLFGYIVVIQGCQNVSTDQYL